MGTLLFDLRESLRGLRRDRGFSAVVIVTLAVTVGAATAAFSIVNGILLKPLSYPDPDRLVTLREIWREVERNAPTLEVNQRHFEYWRQNTQRFASMAQFLTQPANLTSGGPATQIAAVRASASLAEVLGVPVAVGRTMTAADERPGAEAVVILGDGLWRQRFSASPSVLGSSLVIDGRPHTVIGVLPATFRLPEGQRLLANIDALLPMHNTAGWVGDHNNAAIGRLKPGVSLDEARAELDVLQRQAGEIAARETGERVTLAATVQPLSETVVGRSRRGILLLFASILAVLAIACANLTNLALIRALGGARDGAIRSALGASRARLLLRAALDYGVLAVVGGATGAWLAAAALQVFVTTAPVDLPRAEEVTIDGRVLGFALLLTFATGLVVSLLPMAHARGGDPQAALRGGSSGPGQGPGAVRMRAALTALQVALAVTLLAVTALLGASLKRVLDIDYQFNTEGVASLPVAMPASRYATSQTRVETTDRIVAAVQALPGVRTAATTSLLPMRGEGQVNLLLAAGTNVPRHERPSANFRFVAPDYFRVLELTVQRGRMFTLADRERGGLMPAVISASTAERLWPGQDALGREFSRGIDGEAGFVVVGIAADARTTSLERRPPLMVYLPYWWQTRTSLSLLVKAAGDPLALAPAIRRAIEQIDPEIAVGQARLLQQAVDAATAGRRYQMQLFVLFGFIAVLIAGVGVYGVTAYSVSKRRREMNIRVALGAGRASVVGLLLRQISSAIVPGVILGIAGALALGGAVASLLYEVQPGDPIVLALVAAAMTAVAFGASLLAARAGLVLEPAQALRDE